MRVRRAALLVVSGAFLLPAMTALAVWMACRSGITHTGAYEYVTRANANLMFALYLLLTLLCILWISAVGWGRVDPE